MRPTLLIVLAVLAMQGLAGCSATSAGGSATAFEDCFNHPPLYRSQHGCDEGGDP